MVAVEEVPDGAALDSLPGVEFFPGILMPAMLNAHCHLELSGLRGTIPAGCGFEGFVEAMKAAPREGGEAVAKAWDAKMWAEGVGRVWDVCNGTSTFATKVASRIEYHNFIEFFGIGRQPDMSFHTTPHSLYAVDPAAFTRLAEAARGPLSVHFMESAFEVADPAARLVAQTPPEREMILVHNCLVTQRDIDIVMGHFTGPVTWVVCPRSNRHISGLQPPLDLLRRNRLTIRVGTDSLASNDTLSLVDELRLLDAPLAEMLGWVAADRIAPGRTPGIVNLTGVDLRTLTLTENARTKRII